MKRFQDKAVFPTGGLNLDENPNAVRENELLIAENVWYRGASIGTRPGAQYETEADSYSQQTTTVAAVQGGVEYRSANDATRWHVTVIGGNIHTDWNSTVTKDAGCTVTAGAQKYWTFAQHGGVLYAAGGTSTDDFWRWTGAGNASVVAMLDSASAAIYPSYVFEKWNRLFTAGFRDAAGLLSTDITSNPMTVRYSALNQPTNWPIGNTLGGGPNAIGGFSAFGDEYVTAISDYTDNDGDWLIIGTNKRLYVVGEEASSALVPFYIPRKGPIEFGVVHQRAYVNLGLDSGEAIWLSEHGIHSLRQTQKFGIAHPDALISWKIRPLLRTINRSRMRQACGAYWREEGLVVFSVPTGSDITNMLLLILDLKGQEEVTAENARWTIARLSGPTAATRSVNAIWEARSSADQWYLYLGNEAGSVFRLDETVRDDLGYAYSTRIRTRHEDYGSPQAQKVIGDVWLEIQPGGSYTPLYRTIFDFGRRQSNPLQVPMPISTSLIGVSVLGVDFVFGLGDVTTPRRLYAVGTGYTIGHEISHDGKDEPWYLAYISHAVRGHGKAEGEH